VVSTALTLLPALHQLVVAIDEVLQALEADQKALERPAAELRLLLSKELSGQRQVS
jgi:hypothetical protein